jgi:hypothetical protein
VIHNSSNDRCHPDLCEESLLFKPDASPFGSA